MNVCKFLRKAIHYGGPRAATVLTVLVLSMPLFAQNQKFSSSFNDAKLQTVLSTIQNKAKVKFVFNTSSLNNKQRVTATANNEEVGKFLNRILPKFQLEVVWSHGVGVIRKKNTQQTMRITGVIRDGYGEPLTGASVMVMGTQGGATSDQNGSFWFTPVAKIYFRLVISVTKRLKYPSITEIKSISRCASR